jgi:glucose/arabinose dehydrogenase
MVADVRPEATVDVVPDTSTDDVMADVNGDTTPPDAMSGPTWCDLPVPPDAEEPGVIFPPGSPGFCLRRYASVRHPRVIAFAPNGDLFVSSPGTTGPGGTGPGASSIFVIPDTNRDGRADGTLTYTMSSPAVAGLDQLSTVHGLLFRDGSLYFTTQNGVWRVPFASGDRRLAAGVVPQRIAMLDSERWTHTLASGPDGTMYVSMGVYGSTMCPMANAHRGAILAIGPGHSMGGDIVARGFRNPMYIRCQTWGCYAAELTDDGWRAPGQEKIVQFSNNQDYGYPCCYDRNLPSPVNTGTSCSNVIAGLAGYPVGYTPFGHDFEPGNWPAPYNGALFVGLHGEVGSWTHAGITWAPTNPTTHAPITGPEAVFFLRGGPWGRVGPRGIPDGGRVADVAFAPDGRMFFTDDQQGIIYWLAPRTLRVPSAR